MSVDQWGCGEQHPRGLAINSILSECRGEYLTLNQIFEEYIQKKGFENRKKSSVSSHLQWLWKNGHLDKGKSGRYTTYKIRHHNESNASMEVNVSAINEKPVSSQEHLKESSEISKWSLKEMKDEREKKLQEVTQRRGQPKFRKELLKAYSECCAVTGCNVKEVLQAAHIYSYKGESTNHVTNGVLLRADIHTLFDLMLITIDSQSYTIMVSKSLKGSIYSQYAGKKLSLPQTIASYPDQDALSQHNQAFRNMAQQ